MVDFSKLGKKTQPLQSFIESNFPDEKRKFQTRQPASTSPRESKRNQTLTSFYGEYQKMTSQFDTDTFMDATTTESSIRRPPIPAGVELIGIISDKTKVNPWQGKKDPTQSGIRLDVVIDFDMSAAPPEVRAIPGLGDLKTITLTDGVMIAQTESGAIDYSPGKNGRLRQYREATGLNTPGQAFSFRMLVGKPIRVKISHRTYENEVYDDVGALAKV